MFRILSTRTALVASLLTLVACGGGGDAGVANNSGTIEAIAPSAEPVFTIVGSVDPSLDAGSGIFVDLGNQRFSTTTDSQGRYELEIDSATSKSLISVNAQGNGDQETIALASVLGDLETLKSLDGNDSRLTNGELAAVDITSVTAAAMGLGIIENGGQLP